ncbi:hypothetical protein FPV67DRAFT_1378132, partial [Lyophyllum atratum]
QAQDTLNPRTDHRDIMLLSLKEDTNHQFRYARIIGIFHVNAMYSGPAKRGDSSVHRMHFLWVRWFEPVDNVPVDHGWSHRQLDTLRFMKMNEPGAFGFVDPYDVLRACHIIPRFFLQSRHGDREGVSMHARDGDDWKNYLANRFVDRDMLMRYHWDFGVGHIYS